MKPPKSKSSTCLAFDQPAAPPRRSKSECTVYITNASLESEIPQEMIAKRRLRRRPNTGACRRVRQKRQRGRPARFSRRNDDDEDTINDVFSRLQMSTDEDIIRPARQLARNSYHVRQDLIVSQHRHRQQRRESLLAKSRFHGQLGEDETNEEVSTDSIDALVELFGKLTISHTVKKPEAETSSRKRKLPHRYHTDEGPTEPKRLCDRVYVDVLVF